MAEVKAEFVTESGVVLAACMGDICLDHSDAIVNAANEQLNHGGGIAAAISRAAGPIVQQESDAWVQKNGLAITGLKAAHTSAGNLPCKHVIHVAGPIWSTPVGS
jgi:O-acetyl-ADP-ribose deacetylase